MALVHWALELISLVVVARLVMEIALSFNPSYRPTGPMAVLFSFVYAGTDWILKPLRRVIRPLRIGSVSLDLSFMVLFFALQWLTVVVH